MVVNLKETRELGYLAALPHPTIKTLDKLQKYSLPQFLQIGILIATTSYDHLED